MKNIEDIPIALLPDLSDNVPIGVALQSMSKPTKAKRAAQEKVRSYQAASRSKNIDKANRKEEIQEFRRKSYQPKGYNPPVGSVGKKRKSDNLNQKSKGTSFETLRSGSGKSETSDSTKSDMSSDTIYNVTVVDYQKKAKTTIKQADDPSYFLSPEALATWKGIWLAVSAATLIIGILLQGKLYFNTIEGWHYVGLVVYYIITFLEVGRFISGSGIVLYREQQVIDALFLTTTSLAMILPFYFWIFQAKLSLNFFKDEFTYLKIYQIIANHLSLFFLVPEILLTRVLVEKMFAIIPASLIILYHSQVWMTHYVFEWEWPVPFYFENYFTMGLNPIFLFLALASGIGAISIGVILVYVFVDSREKAHKKRKKSKDQAKRENIIITI